MQKNEPEILKIIITRFEEDIKRHTEDPVKIYVGDIIYTNKIDLEELKEFISLFIPPNIKYKLDSKDRYAPLPSLRIIFFILCKYMGYTPTEIADSLKVTKRIFYTCYINTFNNDIIYNEPFKELFSKIINQLNQKWYVPTILSQIKQEWYNTESTLHTPLSEV